MAIEGGLTLTGIDGLRGLEPGLGSGRPPGGWRVCAPRGVCKDFRGSRRGSGYVLEDLQGVGRVWGGLGCSLQTLVATVSLYDSVCGRFSRDCSLHAGRGTISIEWPPEIPFSL